MKRTIYVAGPMRGIRHFNFPAFDKARDELVARGWNVISPADLDREVGFDEKALPEDYDWNDLSKIGFDLKSAVRRDVEALLRSDAIFMLDGYDVSKGATAELFVARWLGLEEYFEGNELPDARYRMLNPGEIIEKGDEYDARNGEWLPVQSSIGGKVSLIRGFRRRLPEPIGDGYRQLEVGEMLEKGDEVFGVDGKWVKTVAAGCEVDRGGKYRRKVESPLAKSVPEVGEGYRKLDVGEKIEQGDEFYSTLNGVWMKALSGFAQTAGYVYRRKIQSGPNPGEGYRFLEVGEKIEKGDEVFIDGEWGVTELPGSFVDKGKYRRKIEQPAKIEQPNEDVLEEALRITRGDRQAQYGPPDQDFRRSAGMLTALFADTLLKEGAKFEPFHIAQMMILLKMSRQLHQRKRDNWVDTAGYARCGAICDEVAK